MFTERIKGQSLKWMGKADVALLPLYGLVLCLFTWCFNFICMGVLPARMSVYHVCTCSCRGQRRYRIPGQSFRWWRATTWHWELNPGLVEEEPVLLNTESPLQPFLRSLFIDVSPST